MTVPTPAGRPDVERTIERAIERTDTPGRHSHRRVPTPEHHPDHGPAGEVLGTSAPDVTPVV
jgi:hypothetical protein